MKASGSPEGGRFVGALIFSAILLGGAGAAVPVWRDHLLQRRGWNERRASEHLRAIVTAEAEFRAQDVDENGVPDFWTGDVAGLYEAGVLDRRIAEADLRPIRPLVPKPVPLDGYYFKALERDDSVPDEYRKDTDGSGRKVHHPSRFGFMALPAEYPSSGRIWFILNEGNSLFKRQSPPPSSADVWPSDLQLKNEWARGG